MFTVTDPGLLNSALLLMQWPFTYCLDETNVQKFLSPHYAAHPGLERAVSLLANLQREISEKLPSDDSTWELARASSKNASGKRAISTTSADPKLARAAAPALDAPLYEAVSVALHRAKAPSTRTCHIRDLHALTRCVWLSSHVALCVLGVARATLVDSNVHFEIASDAARRALLRAWFGVAFDKYARLSDDARLDQFRNISQRTDLLPEMLRYFMRAWRLGLTATDDGQSGGAVMRHRGAVLMPAMKLVVGSIACAAHGKAMQRQEALDNGCAEEFDLMMQQLKALPAAMRPLEPGSRGLRPGALQPSIGLLSAAEMLAKRNLGNDWHDELGHEMVDYLASRVGRVDGVRVIRKELRREMATDKTIPLDVDLFVVDDRIQRVYAVQCKHLEGSGGLGLLDWLERFRRTREKDRKGLDKAVQQLENLQRLCSVDAKIQSYLAKEVGLSPREIESIRPIVVHNVWNVDFWRTDQGICFYDLHTFCNAIDRRLGVLGLITQDAVADAGELRSAELVDLAYPDTVIAAYVNDPDPRWQALANFDATARVDRAAMFGDTLVSAIGLGL
jgi:hypothetical protein